MNDQRPLTDMTDRELWILTAEKVRTIERDMKILGREVRGDHGPRLRRLEEKENRRVGRESTEKDGKATALALIAIVISVVATVGSLLT